MKVSFCHYINFLQHLFSHAKLPNSPSPHEIHNVSAQIYAISLDALVQGKDEITAYLFNTGDPAKPWTTKTSRNDCSNDNPARLPTGELPGFTVWPAKTPGRQLDNEAGGVQYFASSDAAYCEDGTSTRIHVWSLINTSSLQGPAPSLQLKNTFIDSQSYANPPPSSQKDGPIPCGNVVFNETEVGLVDSGDSRVLDTRFAQNKLWVALTTAADVLGTQVAGVAWYIFEPRVAALNGEVAVSADLIKEGVVALENESVSRPAIGVTTSGKGVIAVSCVGPNRYPRCVKYC